MPGKLWPVGLALLLIAAGEGRRQIVSGEPQLIAHWKLRGDCKDSSGNGHHGVNHHVRLEDGDFNGRDSYVEVPDAQALQLGKRDFAVSAWVHTEQHLADVLGDVLSKYDAFTTAHWMKRAWQSYFVSTKSFCNLEMKSSR